MSNLNQLVQWLAPSQVEVVTLEELMVHLRNNFGTPLSFQFERNAGSLTQSNGQFRLRLAGPSGRNVVVEAARELGAWMPIQTNALLSGGLDLSVPMSTNQNQFFRGRLVP